MIFGIIIFTIFAVSLTENLQIADGLLATKSELNYELNKGNTQVLTWTVINSEDVPINVEFYADGEGSELMVFEEFVTIEPHMQKVLDVFVKVPLTIDDVEYRPILHVLQRGTIEEGKSGLVINIHLQAPATIKIGDNPIYTPPVIVETEEEIEEISDEVVETVPEITEPTETMEEKLAKIKASNEANKKDDPDESKSNVVIDTNPVETKQVPIVDDEFVPEPVSDSETDEIVEEDVKECNFLDMILSWFGAVKCA